MRVAIHQPQYLPWLGYFHKMMMSDVFVFLDDVQFKKNEFQNRNRIKTAEGASWLTVPVIHHFPQLISEVEINNRRDWRKKHLRTLDMNYRKAPYFDNFFPLFASGLTRDWEYLSPLNIYSIEKISKALGIKKRFIKSSELAPLENGATDRLIDICRKLGADTYISGAGGRSYLELGKFDEAGIKVQFQEFNHPVYPQLYGKFEPYLSVVDLLFNCGEKSGKIILEGGGR
jgi:hypothetical protein